MNIQGNTLAGLEWDLSKHCEPQEKILVPSKSIINENSKGGYSMRFSDYITKNPNDHDSKEESALINKAYDPIKNPKLPIRQRTLEWYEYQTQRAKRELSKKRNQRKLREKEEPQRSIDLIKNIEPIEIIEGKQIWKYFDTGNLIELIIDAKRGEEILENIIGITHFWELTNTMIYSIHIDFIMSSCVEYLIDYHMSLHIPFMHLMY